MRQLNCVVLVVLLCTAFAATARAQNDFPPPQLLDRITGHGIRAHMAFLADDLLEGRETGTRGYQLAANYVRAQFEQMGLEPAGNNGLGGLGRLAPRRRATPRAKTLRWMAGWFLSATA